MSVVWETDPKPGDIILAASKNPKWALYATMQLLTGSPSMYTHAALCLDNGEYLDHRPGGALIRPLEDLHERRSIAFSRNLLTDEQRAELVRVARAHVSAPYTFWRFGYIAGRTLRVGSKLLNTLDQRCNTATICSELIMRIYQEAQVPFAAWSVDPREVSPGMLARVGVWSHYLAAPLDFTDQTVQVV